MPWHGWLILLLALGVPLSALLLLRDTAKKLPLTGEQLERIKKRNQEQDERDGKER